MGDDARALVDAADAAGDRFVAMQGLAAVSYSANFSGAFAEAEAALRRAEAIAREDDKAYRLTIVLGGLGLGLTLQGRPAESAALFEEAKAANPAYRDSILVELEALVRWIAGDFAGSVAAAREAIAWLPAATSRRRAPGPIYGAMSALEAGDESEAARLLERGRAMLGGASLVLLPGRCATGPTRSWSGIRTAPPSAWRRCGRPLSQLLAMEVAAERGVCAVRPRRGRRGRGRRGGGRARPQRT